MSDEFDRLSFKHQWMEALKTFIGGTVLIGYMSVKSGIILGSVPLLLLARVTRFDRWPEWLQIGAFSVLFILLNVVLQGKVGGVLVLIGLAILALILVAQGLSRALRLVGRAMGIIGHNLAIRTAALTSRKGEQRKKLPEHGLEEASSPITLVGGPLAGRPAQVQHGQTRLWVARDWETGHLLLSEGKNPPHRRRASLLGAYELSATGEVTAWVPETF